MEWMEQLEYDPIRCLISSGNKMIEYFAKRDLLDQKVEPIQTLWELAEVKRILDKQMNDGSWKYPSMGKEHLRSQEDYNQIETYRILGHLVEKYGFNRQHPVIRKAADYLFSCQTEEGDFRGIYGTQYSPNYSAAIMELLMKAGYEDEIHIKKGFDWLLSIRQNDGGWVIPLRTHNMKLQELMERPEPVQPNRSKPFSHLVTGIVLRAFAAHSKYRRSEEAKKAGELLASRFFKPDKYVDRGDVSYWERVSFPFWFTDIVSSLDSLSLIGFEKDNLHINEPLITLKNRQKGNGLFELKIVRGKDRFSIQWISLAICRLFRRFYE